MENKYRVFAFTRDFEALQNNVIPRTMKGQKSRQEMRGILYILKKTVNETWNCFRKPYHSAFSAIGTAHITTRAVETIRHRLAISNNICFGTCLFLRAY
jgi:hypothetical protein